MIRRMLTKLKQWNKRRRVRRYAERHGLERYDGIEDLFTDFYRKRIWTGGGGETVSGSGSTLTKTALLRAGLPGFLDKHGIRIVFDAPCGDYHWFSRIERPGVDYIGGEIVRDLVAENTARYADDHTRFMHFDILKDDAPQADLWFCREVLLHLSEPLVFEFLRNYVRSGIPWLLVTHHHKAEANLDIPTGAGRAVNLEIAPYGLPPPLDTLDDDPKASRPMVMGLWSSEAVAAALGEC